MSYFVSFSTFNPLRTDEIYITAEEREFEHQLPVM